MALIKLSKVRLSFPDLFEPDAKYNRFGAVFVIEPGSVNAKLLADTQLSVAREKWGAKAEGILQELKNKGRVGYVENHKTNSNGEVYDGFQGKYYVAAGATIRPKIIDRDTTPLDPSEGRPYAGCYVDVSLDIWPQDNSFGRRINAKHSLVAHLCPMMNSKPSPTAQLQGTWYERTTFTLSK